MSISPAITVVPPKEKAAKSTDAMKTLRNFDMIIHLQSAFSKIQPFFYCLRPLIERCEEKEGGFADGKFLVFL
jgi:hypothetical protein